MVGPPTCFLGEAEAPQTCYVRSILPSLLVVPRAVLERAFPPTIPAVGQFQPARLEPVLEGGQDRPPREAHPIGDLLHQQPVVVEDLDLVRASPVGRLLPVLAGHLGAAHPPIRRRRQATSLVPQSQ